MPPASSPGSHDSHGQRFTTVDRAARVRFRRAMALMLMTLLLPGSAQLVAGNRKVGIVALRIWFVLVTTVLTTLVVGVLWRELIFRLAKKRRTVVTADHNGFVRAQTLLAFNQREVWFAARSTESARSRGWAASIECRLHRASRIAARIAHAAGPADPVNFQPSSVPRLLLLLLLLLLRQPGHVGHRPDVTELVRVDHGTDGLHHAIGDVEREHVDHAPLRVVRHGAGLAVDPGQPQVGAQYPAAAE